MSETVGLRELRQRASEVVRRAEEGHTVTVTVNGREAARIVPVAPRRWRSWADVAGAFTGPGDPDLVQDLQEFDDVPTDPFDR